MVVFLRVSLDLFWENTHISQSVGGFTLHKTIFVFFITSILSLRENVPRLAWKLLQRTVLNYR